MLRGMTKDAAAAKICYSTMNRPLVITRRVEPCTVIHQLAMWRQNAHMVSHEVLGGGVRDGSAALREQTKGYTSALTWPEQYSQTAVAPPCPRAHGGPMHKRSSFCHDAGQQLECHSLVILCQGGSRTGGITDAHLSPLGDDRWRVLLNLSCAHHLSLIPIGLLLPAASYFVATGGLLSTTTAPSPQLCARLLRSTRSSTAISSTRKGHQEGPSATLRTRPRTRLPQVSLERRTSVFGAKPTLCSSRSSAASMRSAS